MVDNCKCCLLEWPWSPHCCLMPQLLVVFISCLWPYHWLQTLIRKWSFLPWHPRPQPRGSSHLSPPESSCLFQNKLNSKVLGSWNVHWVKAQSQEKLQCCVFSGCREQSLQTVVLLVVFSLRFWLCLVKAFTTHWSLHVINCNHNNVSSGTNWL